MNKLTQIIKKYFIIFLLLQSCSIDNVRINFDKKIKGSLQATFKQLSMHEREEWRKVKNIANICKAEVVKNNSKEFIGTFNFKNRDQLEIFFMCDKKIQELVSIDPIIINKGFFSDEYIISFEMNYPPPYGFQPPKVISITVPGNVTTFVINKKKNNDYFLKKEIIGNDRVIIKTSFPLAEKFDIIARKMEKTCLEYNTSDKKKESCLHEHFYNIIHITIKSKIYKFSWEIVISLLGILFGSGVLLELYKVYRKR